MLCKNWMKWKHYKNQQTWRITPCPHKSAVNGSGLNGLSCQWAQGFRFQYGAKSGDKAKKSAQLGQEGQSQQEPAPLEQASCNKVLCLVPYPPLSDKGAPTITTKCSHRQVICRTGIVTCCENLSNIKMKYDITSDQLLLVTLESKIRWWVKLNFGLQVYPSVVWFTSNWPSKTPWNF